MLSHHLTNGRGCGACLSHHTCRIRRHSPEGDVRYINGEVSKKFVDDQGRHCVEISQKAIQQDDALSIQGTGVVVLPSRG